MNYNLVDSLRLVSDKQTILQPGLGNLELNIHSRDVVMIYMGSGPIAKGDVIAVERTNIDRLILALQWAKLAEGDFFFHAKRYFRTHKKLSEDNWPQTKVEIIALQNEFEDWCLGNEQKIRKRIAKDKADSVKGSPYNVRATLKRNLYKAQE